MQIITISGWLSRDAEQQTTQGGDTVTRWNVPVKQGWGDKEQTNWFRVNIWGKRSDFAANARKGDFAAVTGELVIGEYQGKPQYEIRASDFHTVRTAPKDDTGGAASRGRDEPANGTGGGNKFATDPDDLDDSIPFARNDSIW